jgi:transposase
VEQRTALINRIRGLLFELGIVLPLKAATVRREAHKLWVFAPQQQATDRVAATAGVQALWQSSH